MEIKFYLMADPAFDGKLRVKEYWQGTKSRVGEKGKTITESDGGHVDGDIITQNRDHYNKFLAFVLENSTTLYEAARAQPSVPYFFEYDPTVEEEAKKPQESELEEVLEEEIEKVFTEELEEETKKSKTKKGK